MERYTDTISGEELYLNRASGNKRYYKDQEMNIRHRLDGPAVERGDDGYKAWYVNDKQHRLDGPAVEYAGGYKEWWVDGVFIIKTNPDGRIILRMK